MTLPAPKYGLGEIVRHVKTGRNYQIYMTSDFCRIEATGEPAYAYREWGGGQNLIWIRPQAEMEDGRFDVVAL